LEISRSGILKFDEKRCQIFPHTFNQCPTERNNTSVLKHSSTVTEENEEDETCHIVSAYFKVKYLLLIFPSHCSFLSSRVSLVIFV